MNTATFIGYKRKGISGGVVATLGVVFPSVVIITIIAASFKHFQDYKIVKHAFGGIRVAVVALILEAIIKMWDKSIKDITGIIIFIISFSVIAFFKVSPIVVIVISATLGIIISNKRIRGDVD